MKIANKITFSFFITALVLTSIVASVFYFIARDNLERAISEHLKTAIQKTVFQVDTFLKMNLEKVEQFSKSAIIRRLLQTKRENKDYKSRLNDVTQRLKSIKSVSRYLYDFFVMDRDGIVVVSTDEKDIGKDRGADSYFVSAKKSPFTKSAYVSRHKKKGSLVFFIPFINDTTGEFLGILAARSTVEGLNKITTDRTGLGKTGEIYIINKDGYMITPSLFVGDAFLKQKVDTENTRRAFEDIKEFGRKVYLRKFHKPFIYSDYRGIKVLGIHEHIFRTEWIVFAEIDKKEAFAPLAALKLILLSVLIFVPLAAWIIGVFVSRIISEPICKLHKGTEIIGSGNLNYKTAITSKDEIGQLSRAFDKMTNNLKETVASLQWEIGKHRKAEDALQNTYRKLKDAQQQLIESEKLRVVGQIASGVAHEVRNPLGIIMQVINYIENKIMPMEEDISKALGMAKNSVKRADKIISALLNIPKATKLELHPERINSLLESSLSLIKDKIKNIKIIKETESGLPKVLVDKNKLEQVFINLFLNSADAMPKTGSLVIRSYDKEFKEIKNSKLAKDVGFFEPGEQVVVVEIEDTGMGISEENQKKIFDPFFTTKSSSKGTGLGLFMSKKIIDKHNCLIGIESHLGKGTKVTIVLKIIER